MPQRKIDVNLLSILRKSIDSFSLTSVSLGFETRRCFCWRSDCWRGVWTFLGHLWPIGRIPNWSWGGVVWRAHRCRPSTAASNCPARCQAWKSNTIPYYYRPNLSFYNKLLYSVFSVPIRLAWLSTFFIWLQNLKNMTKKIRKALSFTHIFHIFILPIFLSI